MSTFTFRKAGPSGRGEGRVRYHVSLESGQFLGSVEGAKGSWTCDCCRIDVATIYPTRLRAAQELLKDARLPVG